MISALFTSSHGPRSSGRYFIVVSSSGVGFRFQPPPVVLIQGTLNSRQVREGPLLGQPRTGAQAIVDHQQAEVPLPVLGLRQVGGPKRSPSRRHPVTCRPPYSTTSAALAASIVRPAVLRPQIDRLFKVVLARLQHDPPGCPAACWRDNSMDLCSVASGPSERSSAGFAT